MVQGDVGGDLDGSRDIERDEVQGGRRMVRRNGTARILSKDHITDRAVAQLLGSVAPGS